MYLHVHLVLAYMHVCMLAFSMVYACLCSCGVCSVCACGYACMPARANAFLYAFMCAIHALVHVCM